VYKKLDLRAQSEMDFVSLKGKCTSIYRLTLLDILRNRKLLSVANKGSQDTKGYPSVTDNFSGLKYVFATSKKTSTVDLRGAQYVKLLNCKYALQKGYSSFLYERRKSSL
jgi:hypothetical protein